MCVQLGKICVQTVVNVQGVEFIAAFTAINRVDDFAMTPQQNIAHASTTFMAQNRGAGKIERMKKGFFSSILLQAIYTAVIAAVTFFFSRQIMELFVGENSEEVVSLGISYLVLIAPMYIMPAATNIIQGYFRGIGNLKITLWATLLQIPIRVALTYLLLDAMGVEAVAAGTIIGWICMALFEVFCYRRWGRFDERGLVWERKGGEAG